jgi:hypothetical protein
MRWSLEEIDKKAPELVTMDDKDLLMKHATIFMNELIASVRKNLNQMWSSLNVPKPAPKEVAATIARIVAKLIAQISHGNPNVSSALLENIRSNHIKKDGTYEFDPTIYGTKDNDDFDHHGRVLTGGKTLKIDEKVKEKESKEIGDMLKDFFEGNIDKNKFRDEIENMKEDIDTSGIFPDKINPEDKNSINENSKTLDQEIPKVASLESSEAEDDLTRQLAENILEAKYAGKARGKIPREASNMLLDKAVDQ